MAGLIQERSFRDPVSSGFSTDAYRRGRGRTFASVSGEGPCSSRQEVAHLEPLESGEPSFPLSELVHQLDFTPFFPKIKNRISAADEKNIADMYEKGLSLREIALQFGYSKNRVRSKVRRLGLKLRNQRPQATHLRSLKSGKQSARPYYGFCYFEGEIVKDPREFPVLQMIHRFWSCGKSIHQINLELNRARILSRTGKTWSWAAIQNIVARFKTKKVVLLKGGKYEFR